MTPCRLLTPYALDARTSSGVLPIHLWNARRTSWDLSIDRTRTPTSARGNVVRNVCAARCSTHCETTCCALVMAREKREHHATDDVWRDDHDRRAQRLCPGPCRDGRGE